MSIFPCCGNKMSSSKTSRQISWLVPLTRNHFCKQSWITALSLWHWHIIAYWMQKKNWQAKIMGALEKWYREMLAWNLERWIHYTITPSLKLFLLSFSRIIDPFWEVGVNFQPGTTSFSQPSPKHLHFDKTVASTLNGKIPFSCHEWWRGEICAVRSGN